MSLAGKSVVITGAGSGVGRASALRFAQEGAKVIVADVQDDGANETVRLVNQAGGTAIAVHCDVASEKDVAAAIEAAVSRFGRLDVMFNNAGVTGFTKPGIRFEDETLEDWQRLNDINFRGVFFGCKHAVIRFKAQGGGGVIINIASDACKVPTPGEAVIGAAMAGITMFSRGLALEAKRNGIRVNTLTPSLIQGTLTYDRVMADPFSAKLFGSAVKQAHLGVVEPDDLAGLIVFLASPQGARLTGQTISVNGGISIA